MPSPKLEDFTRVLIVEGYSDLLFYAEFLEAIGKPNLVFIKAFNGKSDVSVQLETFITPELLKEKAKIAVIVDADDSAAGAIDSVRNKLTTITEQPVTAHGTWTGGTPDIGLFVTPDGQNVGEIETLVWRAWSADAKNAAAKTCIEQYRDCMAAAGRIAKSPDKGLLSTLLAIHNDEDPRLGPGAQKKIFDFDRPEFAGLRAFLLNF